VGPVDLPAGDCHQSPKFAGTTAVVASSQVNVT